MPVENGLAGGRVLRIVLPLLVVGAGLVIPPAPSDTDLYWHLSMGRAALATHARTFPDPVGPDAAALYTNPEWVFDTLVYGLQTLGGPLLISALVALLAGLSAWLTWRLARVYAGPDAPWTALGITALVVGATNWQFTARPQSLFHVLLPLFLLTAHRAARDGGAAWLGLSVVGLVWAQSHSSMVLMPALFPQRPRHSGHIRRQAIG